MYEFIIDFFWFFFEVICTLPSWCWVSVLFIEYGLLFNLFLKQQHRAFQSLEVNEGLDFCWIKVNTTKIIKQNDAYAYAIFIFIFSSIFLDIMNFVHLKVNQLQYEIDWLIYINIFYVPTILINPFFWSFFWLSFSPLSGRLLKFERDPFDH